MQQWSSIDLRGRKFGRLTVVSKCRGRRYYWNCLCSCGKTHIAKSYSLKYKEISSCGCLRKEIMTKEATTHGLSESRVYLAWRHMLNRCNNPNDKRYSYYGGRGINICDRWLKFENFFADMGHDNGLQIDRIDNDRGYEPGNCRWATRKENARNKRNNHMIKFRGETKCIAEWAEVLGLPNSIVHCRLQRGWTTDKILLTPPNHKHAKFKK